MKNEEITINEKVLGEGITVGELINFLNSCPRDAKVLLNHKTRISNPEDDGSYSYGWIFDTIAEGRCEKIADKERFIDYKKDDKIVWLTYQYE